MAVTLRAEPVTRDDGIAFPVALALLDCLCAELDDAPGGKVCQCTLLPGVATAMDFCDCGAGGCGMGWVQIASVYPSTVFPVPSNTPSNCAVPYAVALRVGAHRCVPGLGAGGEAPTAQAQTEATRIQLGDMAAIRRAVECCARIGGWADDSYVLGPYTPTGPDGNCAGGSWLVTVQVI